jgi:hypothetical protein
VPRAGKGEGVKANPLLVCVLSAGVASLIACVCCVYFLRPSRAPGGSPQRGPLLSSDWGSATAPSEYELDLNDLGTQLLFSTVPIVARRAEGAEQGTGFVFNYERDGNLYPLLITNRHVVADAQEGAFYMVSARDGKPDVKRPIAIHFDATLFRYTRNGPDLALALIGPLVNETQAQGKPLFFRSLHAELVPDRRTFSGIGAVEETIFVGYPWGLMDASNRTPLFRRGITATPPWNNFEGRPVFLIDANVYEGSSGSPAFIHPRSPQPLRTGRTAGDRLFFVGVVTGTVKETNTRQGTQTYLGLGIVINSHAVLDFIEETMKEVLAEREKKAAAKAAPKPAAP